MKSVNTKYNGAVIRFKVGRQASDRVGLVTERIISLKCFDAKEPSNSNSDRRNYGNNRAAVANLLQWLNSAAGAGQWYSAQHSADAPPNNANVWSNYNEYEAEAGFLHGFEQDFRDALLNDTITVAKSSTDGGGSEQITRKVRRGDPVAHLHRQQQPPCIPDRRSGQQVGIQDFQSVVFTALVVVASHPERRRRAQRPRRRFRRQPELLLRLVWLQRRSPGFVFGP